jgi:hypothetical protein
MIIHVFEMCEGAEARQGLLSENVWVLTINQRRL